MTTTHPPRDIFRGAIVRNCVLKNVVDGKTLKVLLNPLGWTPRPHGGWRSAPTSLGSDHQYNDAEASWEEVTVRLMCVDTEEHQVPKGKLLPPSFLLPPPFLEIF
jgi:endonuclease YncB( thermonuclease family)|tara:strand:- start:3228 stop:3542 length:315 start_codon:yes stop_codon:yes gene_type:complete